MATQIGSTEVNVWENKLIDYCHRFEFLSATSRQVALAVCVVLLAIGVSGCGGPSAPPLPTIEEVASIVADSPSGDLSNMAGVRVVGDAMPLPPAFAQDLMGLELADLAFELTTNCIGHFDSFTLLYTGERTGLQASGWAWDIERVAPFPAFVATNQADQIIGASEESFQRPDVLAALPRQINRLDSGWLINSRRAKGEIIVYGYDPSTKSLCKIGGRPSPQPSGN